MSIQVSEPTLAKRKNTLTPRRPIPWRLPVFLAIGCGLIGFVVATMLPHWYRVNTTLYFPSQGSSDSAAGIIGKVVGDNASGGASSDIGSVSLLGGMFQQPVVASGSATAIAVLASNRCKEAVSHDLDLPELWHMKKRAEVLATLDQIVTYGVDKNNLLNIEVDNTNPKLAVAIANSYLKNLRQIANDMSTNYSHQNRVFIEQELADARQKLSMQEAELVAMQKRGGLKTVSTTADDKITSAYVDLQSRKLEAQLSLDAINKQIAFMLHAANVTVAQSASLPRDIPVAQDARARLRDLEAKFAYDKETLGPDNPQYNADKIQLETTRAEMTDEVKREAMALREGITPDIATLFATRASVQATRDGLVDASKRMESLLTSLPEPQMQATQLQGDIKITGNSVGMLEAEAEKARIAERRDMTAYMVVDTPEMPEDPFKPRRGTATALSIVAGFMIGCAWLVAGALRKNAAFDQEAED